MECDCPKHAAKGVSATGNRYQPPGHHRFGIALIPLGDRNRDCSIGYEERDSIDISTSKKR